MRKCSTTEHLLEGVAIALRLLQEADSNGRTSNAVWYVFPRGRTAGDKIRVQYEGKSFDVTLPGGVAVGQPFEITGLLNAPQSKGQVEAEEDQTAIDNSLQTAADDGVPLSAECVSVGVR